MRLRWWVIPIVVVWLAWRNSADQPLDLTAGSTKETFGFLDRTSGRFVERAPDGVEKREVRVEVGKDARVVGSNRGTSLLWQDGRKVALAPVDDPGDKEQFGKRVERLCTQTASTRTMFGAAWVERDGAIWILRGYSYDANPARATLVASELEAADPFCAVTNAVDDLVLLYRFGNHTEIIRCEDNRDCGRPRKVALPSGDDILGIGCTEQFCVIATRSRKGVTTLTWIDGKDKVLARRELPACKDSGVTLAGQDRHVAIGYSNGPSPVVDTTDEPGTLVPVFVGEGDANTTPVVAWWESTLQLAFQRDGAMGFARFTF